MSAEKVPKGNGSGKTRAESKADPTASTVLDDIAGPKVSHMNVAALRKKT